MLDNKIILNQNTLSGFYISMLLLLLKFKAWINEFHPDYTGRLNTHLGEYQTYFIKLRLPNILEVPFQILWNKIYNTEVERKVSFSTHNESRGISKGHLSSKRQCPRCLRCVSQLKQMGSLEKLQGLPVLKILNCLA